MPKDDLIHINISKVIHAQKSSIIRLATRVWEFPSYMPTVKEAKVLSRKHNTMKTKWRVQVDGVPISWVEEDTLELRGNVISFKAIEGDLQEFYGEWKFNDHPEGTEVVVSVHLRVGIPAIKEFADEYIRNMLAKNFAAMLGAWERRLISIKYASFKQGNLTKLAGFGVLGHFYNFNHLARCLKTMNPDFKMPSEEFLTKLFTMTPSFKIHEMKEFKSKIGVTTSGCFIVCTFVPEMLSSDLHGVYSKVVRACKIAEKHGVGIVTLGGFTSIVGERLGQQINEEVDIAITTGNTYTVALIIEAVERAVKLLGKDLKDLKVAIVGGTGDIGSGCARVLAGKVRELAVTGRTKSNLRSLRSELAKKRKARIVATTDNQSAINDADIVIAAASATASILKIDWFKPGSIICDVGYPKNISYAPTTRDDILVFSGGLAKTPTKIEIPIDIGLPDAGVSYGCFCEAIILALEKRYESFSFGRGNITPEKIEEITALGKKHGFGISDFYWGNKRIDETTFEKIKMCAVNR
ncbi:MAG TPA: hypothetical protein ENH41_02315 [Candidatus Omnitrophica bacterium]|nr:hypothetical protein [Candidatus Omnitrophota bacterium]